MKLEVLLALILILIIPPVMAQDYYADLKIEVDNTDFASIKGNTDVQGLLTEGTEQYIFKDKGVRTLNIETQEIFSEYYITLNLPSGTAINYIKSSGTFRIEGTLGKLSIITFAEDKPISITVQYQIQKTSTKVFYHIASILITIGVLLALLPKIIRWLKPFPKAKEFDFKGLTPRQRKIVELLIEKDRPMTQTEIEDELNLPKSSVSRNIHTLEMKGTIEKERIGMSNKIRLKTP